MHKSRHYVWSGACIEPYKPRFNPITETRKLRTVLSDSRPHMCRSLYDMLMWNRDRWVEISTKCLSSDWPHLLNSPDQFSHDQVKVVAKSICMAAINATSTTTAAFTASVTFYQLRCPSHYAHSSLKTHASTAPDRNPNSKPHAASSTFHAAQRDRFHWTDLTYPRYIKVISHSNGLVLQVGWSNQN